MASLVKELIEELGGMILVAGLVIWAGNSFMHRDEITTYLVFCDGEMSKGTCNGKLETSGKTSYKVFKESQSVVQRTADGAIYHLRDCAVWDTQNWRCSEKGGLATYEQTMNDGEFSGKTIFDDGKHDSDAPAGFYYTSEYRWWMIKFREAL